jgi:RHH-type transcriptional regulator, rel operon repressor / antitoxin RelB
MDVHLEAAMGLPDDKQLLDQLAQDLAELVALTGQSESEIRCTALRDYLAWRLPEIRDLQIALAQAGRGEFATEEEVREVFARYGA